MGKIVKADAWCNGEVAYLAWQADGPIADCLGFMITRVRETGPKAGRRRILPTWIAFRDQSNPDWLDQDSSVWPIQSYEWRDLTLRRSRDSTSVRPIDFKVHYEIVPVGPPGPGRQAVPTSSTAVSRAAAGPARRSGRDADDRRDALLPARRRGAGDVHQRDPLDAEPAAATRRRAGAKAAGCRRRPRHRHQQGAPDDAEGAHSGAGRPDPEVPHRRRPRLPAQSHRPHRE